MRVTEQDVTLMTTMGTPHGAAGHVVASSLSVDGQHLYTLMTSGWLVETDVYSFAERSSRLYWDDAQRVYAGAFVGASSLIVIVREQVTGGLEKTRVERWDLHELAAGGRLLRSWSMRDPSPCDMLVTPDREHVALYLGDDAALVVYDSHGRSLGEFAGGWLPQPSNIALLSPECFAVYDECELMLVDREGERTVIGQYLDADRGAALTALSAERVLVQRALDQSNGLVGECEIRTIHGAVEAKWTVEFSAVPSRALVGEEAFAYGVHGGTELRSIVDGALIERAMHEWSVPLAFDDFSLYLRDGAQLAALRWGESGERRWRRPDCGWVLGLVWGPDGDMLLSQDYFGVVRRWSVSSGAQVGEFVPNGRGGDVRTKLQALCDGGATALMVERSGDESGASMVAYSVCEHGFEERWRVAIGGSTAHIVATTEDAGTVIARQDSDDEGYTLAIVSRASGALDRAVFDRGPYDIEFSPDIDDDGYVDVVLGGRWMSIRFDAAGVLDVRKERGEVEGGGMVVLHRGGLLVDRASRPSRHGRVIEYRSVDGSVDVCRINARRIAHYSLARSVPRAALGPERSGIVTVCDFLAGQQWDVVVFDAVEAQLDAITVLALSEDGLRLAVGTARGLVRVFELR